MLRILRASKINAPDLGSRMLPSIKVGSVFLHHSQNQNSKQENTRRSDTHVQDLRLIGLNWTMPFQTFITNWAKGLNWNTSILGSGFCYETHILGGDKLLRSSSMKVNICSFPGNLGPALEKHINNFRLFFLYINHLLVVSTLHEWGWFVW